MTVPKYDGLFNPLLEALHELGNSASVSELEEKVAEILKLSDAEISEIHRGNRTKLSYRLAWARNYLKRFGLLENSSRGVWSLTSKGVETKSVDKDEVNKTVKNIDKTEVDDEVQETGKSDTKQPDWQDELLEILKSLGGFLSFKVIFQCKRYQGTVTSQQIREFKGTMVGRADKGLLITTGSFTRDAKLEASRDGSTPIDLVDGEQLVEKMKELGLGIFVRTEEVVTIDEDWFKNF